MPKLLWVALPLLMLAPLAGWLWLRRRPAWRLTLNVWSSLLLLAYLATTAGLGIFWVASQQLPVFDWHYLFGYLTLVLLALHLALNLGTVWRFLTRLAGQSAAGSAAGSAAVGKAGGRRPLLGAFGVFGALGALGAIAALGAAFGLGQRHERRKSGSAAAASVPQAASAGLAAVEQYHALSSHARADLLRRAPSLALSAAPAPFKHYPHAGRVALPPPDAALSATAAAPIGLAAMGALLWHTAGVTATRAGLALRASPSSGGLFSTELYLVSNAVAGLAAGLWHYDARAHALERLAAPSSGAAEAGAITPPALQGGSAAVIATALFARTGHKYGQRCYRYVLADLGHALENLRQASGAVGAAVHFVAAFDEAQIAATLGLDEAVEGVLALAVLQPKGAPSPAAAAWAAPPEGPASKPYAPAQGPLASDPVAAVHAVTSLRGAGPGRARPAAQAAPAGTATAASISLPQTAPSAENPLETIRQRRSVRRFADRPLPGDALAAVLAAMAARAAPLMSAAVRVYVVVNAVTGMPPGAYRYDAVRHALLPQRRPEWPPRPLREQAQAAALDQDVIGGAAAVFVLSIDRLAFASDPTGPARGYRHAMLQAGMVGERIYLEAGARGLGSCAVGAFYDNEAAALLAIDPAREWVVHFAALGMAQA